MKENNIRNSVVGSLFWKFGERVASQGVSFIISMILARLLMPEDYGTIALVTVFINLAAVFINSGFATALIQKKDADSVDFSTMFYCSLICSVLIYLLLYAVAPWVAEFYSIPELKQILRVFALQVPLSAYNSIQTAYVSRHMMFQKVFVSSVIVAVGSGVIGIAMAYAGFGVWALVFQTMLATVISTVVLSFLIPWKLEWKFSKTSAVSMMKYGSRVLGADLSGTFFGEVRSLIIGRVYTSADLAFYNKGQQLPTLITSNLSTTLISVMFPAMANFSDDLVQVKSMAKRSMRILSYVLVPCLFGLAAVMEPLVIVLFTEKWIPTIRYAQVLSFGLCIGVFGIIPVQILKAIGRSDVVLNLEIYKKPVYVLLLVIGVSIDVFALAVAMAVYDVYGVFVNMLQMKKQIGYTMKEQLLDLMPAFLLGTGMMLTVLLIPSFGSMMATLIVKIAAGIVFYVGMSAVFKVESFYYLLDMVRSVIRK